MNEMVHWKFKCKNCGYRFKAITPVEDYEKTLRCSHCGSTSTEKKATKKMTKYQIIKRGK